MNSCGADSEAEGYIDGVLSGEIVAGRWVRLMCERHRRDLASTSSAIGSATGSATGSANGRGLWFDRAAAQHVLDFFLFLRHSKGEWAGQVIQLEPWQQAVLWVLFGWYKADGTRRFRTSYWEIARKNGKSTIAAGVGLYLMIGDGERGAEVYSAATKREQARITHQEAMRMVKASAALKKRVTCFRDNLHIRDTATKFEPLGRDADSMDGLNVHGAIVDELHAHKSDEVWGVLETATGSRKQPLMFGITTAGFNQDSYCFQLRDYAIKVLEGVVEDDSFFGVIFSLDEGDDWRDEGNWVKANPNLGVSVKWDDLRDKAKKAKEIGRALTHFLTKHLNVWTNADELWIGPDKWKACGGAIDVASLAGRECYGGLDLSNTLDVTAWVLVFPPLRQAQGAKGDQGAGDDDRYIVLCKFWVPEETVRSRSRDRQVPYNVWVREGYIEAIPGEVIDYEYIYAQIDRDSMAYNLKEIGYDRWGAAEVYLRMAKRGMVMVQIGQGYQSMSPPMKKLEELVVGGRLAHGDNPVLTWMAHNLVATQDPAGNIKPDKRKSREKIDGMVALIMGLDRASRHEVSMYDAQGIREV